MSYRIRFHPAASADLNAILNWIASYSGVQTAERRLAEIEAVITSLKATPHVGSIHDDISPGLRAIPAGRKAVIAFVVDDEQLEALIYAISYAGTDWVGRSRDRGR